MFFLNAKGQVKGLSAEFQTVTATTVNATSFVGNLAGAPVLPTYTVATLPPAATSANMLVFCSDGAVGGMVLAFCKPGTPNTWVQVALGAVVSAV